MAENSPINIEDLLERVDGNIDFALEMLDKFFNSFKERIGEIQTFIDTKNFPEIKNSTHRLKGITGNLSLMKCFNILVSLEHKAMDKNINACGETLKQAEESIIEAYEYYLTNQDLFY